jgi:pyruvate formate lyase activating enzyme
MTDPTGVIFNIQRFSVHDGPGIRTTVFMKGCPLKCLWCSNPESQRPEPQLMARDVKCKNCGACVDVCSRDALFLDDDGIRRINWDRCDNCLECVNACLYGALVISGRQVSLEEIQNEVESDRVFYNNSGGGVTVSGGEPLMQPEFVTALFRACRELNIHTALDTTGFARPDILREVLTVTDLCLYDIKTLDPDLHRQMTGVDLKPIIDNAQLASSQTRTWFRVPLIAGVNDSIKMMESLAQLALDTGAEKISLLPYHQGGEQKALQIGSMYGFELGREVDSETTDSLRDVIQSMGVEVGVGN